MKEAPAQLCALLVRIFKKDKLHDKDIVEQRMRESDRERKRRQFLRYYEDKLDTDVLLVWILGVSFSLFFVVMLILWCRNQQ